MRDQAPLPLPSNYDKTTIEMASQGTTVSTGRCEWGDKGGELYVKYHDTEWGVPVHDDHKQFEFLMLEGAQAGLSWLTVLRKREAYRKAFSDFDPVKVARFSEKKIETLIQNPGIIRNRLKIKAAVSNARAFLEVQKEFDSFDDYIWGFVGGKTLQNSWETMSELPATSPQSEALSTDLKKRGFKFVGSTIMYAHMQAAGMVNDHLVTCFRYRECAALA
jgi:DNA-3-methyladenine glycosylase I